MSEEKHSDFWLATASLAWRELIRFYRYRSRVVGALGTPLVFWLLIGSGIGTSFRASSEAGGANYLEYFFPGTATLVLLFTSIFCMMSVIEDRQQGFLLSVLVAPISRSALVLGKVLGGSVLAVLQAFLFILLAPLVGISLDASQLLLIVAALFLIAFGLASLGFAVAWRLNSTQGFHAVVNLFLIPMWLLSGALFPPSGASEWVRWVMRLNPLTYATAALRRVLYGNLSSVEEGLPGLGVSLGVTLAFAVAMALLAFTLARHPTRGETG